MNCFCIEETFYYYPQKSVQCLLIDLQVCYTHCNVLLCFKSSKMDNFNILRVERMLRKPCKDMCSILCGEKMKLHLESGAHMPVQLCPSPMGWRAWGTKERYSPGVRAPLLASWVPGLLQFPAQGPWAPYQSLQGLLPQAYLFECWLCCPCVLVCAPMHTRPPPSLGWRCRKRRWLDPPRC